MFISKKRLANLFYDFTIKVYKDLGRNLSKKDELIVKNKILKFIESNKIKDN